MDANTLMQILTAAVLILVPAVGWLVNQVIRQGQLIAAADAVNLSKAESFKASCIACQQNFDRRITDNRAEAERRFSELVETLNAMNSKLDTLILRIAEKK